MAQHDYNIANQSGADFRADLNNALGAIATTNSGATEPSTTFAHQLWVDTGSNVLKIRNGTDSAWITTGISITTSNILTGDLTGNVTGNLTGNVTGNVTGDLTGNADTATTLATARTISLSGDVAGSASFDGSGDITITTTAQIDSIALGTDTTGDYVESLSGGTGVTVTGGTGEGSTPSVAIGQSVATTDNVTFNIVTASEEFIGDLEGGIRFNAKADGALSKGDVVYISGVSGDVPTVGQAKADDASKMPAFGLALSDANDNAALQVVTFGTIEGLDTSGVSEGQILYVSTTAGAYTTTAPTGESAQIQNIGKVIRSHAAAGSIKVGGAGRSNATPNLDDGKIFIGNASNQSSTATLDTSIVVENTNLYYTDTRANSAIDARVTNTFINNLTGVVADTATALATARTISLSGDIAGSASFDGTSDITITSTIQPNSIALGTDTVGNYIQTITGTANKITVTGSGSESADVTLTLPDDVQIADSLTVAGNLTVNGTLTSLDTTNLDIEDNLFQLNAGLTGSPVNDSGMLINRGNQDNGIFMWDESVDKFTLGLTTADGTSTGNITLNSLGTLVANIEGNVTGNVTGTVSSLSNHDTGDLTEGTNLYYTQARFDSAFTGKSTSDLSEGTNLYYTDARFDTRLATKDTDDVSEGTTNLYYTDARVQAVSINNVVEDTTPQLGGDLASNGNDILFADNDKAIFGAGSDLEIYHSGSASHIKETGTGNLKLEGTNIELNNGAGNKTYILAVDGGAVQLRYDDATKLVTTSTGIDVTGTATMDGLTVDGDITVSDATPSLTLSDTGGTNQKFVVSHNGATSYLTFRNGTNYGALQFLADNGTANVTRQSISSGGDISFYEDTGTTAKFFWDASAESLGIGTTSPSADLETLGSSGIKTGNGSGTGLFKADGGSTKVGSFSNHRFDLVTNNTTRASIDTAGKVGIGTSSPSYKLDVDGDINIGDGVLRLETTSSGFPSTGLVHFSNNFLYQRGGSNGIIFAPAGGGSEIARFTGAGEVIIGGESPLGSSIFTVDSDSAAISVFDSSAASGGYLQFRNNNTPKGLIGFGANSGANSTNDMILSSSSGSIDITIPETAGAAIRLEFGNNVNTTRRTVQAYKDNFEPAAADTGVIGLGQATNKFKDLHLAGDANIDGEVTGNTFAYSYYNSSSTTLTTSYAVVNLDTLQASTGISGISISSNVVTVSRSGTFMITMDIVTDVTSGTARTESEAQLYKNGSAVTGTFVGMYNRITGAGLSTGTATTMISVSSGDTFEIRAKKTGTDTVVTSVGGTRLTFLQVGN